MSNDLYVYAVTTPAAARQDLGTGIDGRAVRVVTAPGEVAAVVHEHDGGPYDGADHDVRRWVLEHSDVVDRTSDASDAVLPVSFNVIVAGAEDESAQDRLSRWLADNAEGLGGRLATLHGRVELRIEVSLESHAVAERHPDTAAMREALAGRPAGVQRLLSKRIEHRERELADALADELYPEYRRRLAALAEDLVENRGNRAETGHVPVLSFSVLVSREQVEDVGSELAAIRDEEPAARIRFLGPWPPYSFADVPEVTQ